MSTQASSGQVPEQFVVEVSRKEVVEDPPLNIFLVRVQANGVWQETYGSKEQLRAFLRGLQAGLYMTGYFMTSLDWLIPDRWQSPTTLRWTIRRGELPEFEEF